MRIYSDVGVCLQPNNDHCFQNTHTVLSTLGFFMSISHSSGDRNCHLQLADDKAFLVIKVNFLVIKNAKYAFDHR